MLATEADQDAGVELVDERQARALLSLFAPGDPFRARPEHGPDRSEVERDRKLDGKVGCTRHRRTERVQPDTAAERDGVALAPARAEPCEVTGHAVDEAAITPSDVAVETRAIVERATDQETT
ncbi:MAG: hypothetical protein ACM3JC_03355, partial [Rudaea sp.]